MNNFSTVFDYGRYTQHLKSTQWKMLKKQYWWSSRPNNCWACDKKAPSNYDGFNFHHRTYKNLFNETLDDVVLLCREHHFDLEKWLLDVKKYGETVETWTPKYIKTMRDSFNLPIKSIARWI
jgi:hypothetical protein